MDIDELEQHAQHTEDASDRQKTIDGYRSSIRLMQTFLVDAYGLHRTLLDATGNLISKPTIKELEIFMESRREIKPDMRLPSLQKYRSAVKKFIEKSDGTVHSYTDNDLKHLKR